MRTSVEVLRCDRAKPTHRGWATSRNTINMAGKLRHEPSRSAATAYMASVLSKVDPSLEQQAFEEISAQLRNYPAQSRPQPLLFLANNLFETRDPFGTASLKDIRATGAKIVIPPRSNRRYSRTLYRTRNLVERFLNRIKHFRRVSMTSWRIPA